MVGGDKNKLQLQTLLDALPKCRQIVNKCTYKAKTLDVILTNLGAFYSPVYIAKAVQPDDPTKGVPSDHSTAVAEPLAGAGATAAREYTVRSSRPLPESGIQEFGAWLQGVQWYGHLTPDLTPTQQAETMERILNQQVDITFPTKSVRVSSQDLPYITGDIKKLDRYINPNGPELLETLKVWGEGQMARTSFFPS